jgi:predicted transcriptional regulator
MEDMEGENDRLSKEVLELQELVKTKPTNSSDKTAEARSKVSKPSSEEINKLKTELMEKNKEIEHLNEALTQAEKNKGKIVVQRSRSLESSESALDLKVLSYLYKKKNFLVNNKGNNFLETTATRRTRGRHFAFQNGRVGNRK